MKENILLYEAEKLISESVDLKKYKLVTKTFNDRDLKELRTLSQIVTKEKGIVCILCSISKNANIVISRSEDVNINTNSFFNSILDIIDGNGGGNQKICQGCGKAENIDKALERAIDIISNY